MPPPVATILHSRSTLHRAPGRIAVDAAGNAYTTEAATGRIVVTNPVSGVIAVRDGFSSPVAIAIDSEGSIYVGERGTGSVSLYDEAWNFLHRLGQGSGEFSIPSDIAIDRASSNETVYVADGGLHVIKAYSRSGQLLSSFGSHGAGPGQFDFPAAVHVSDAGEIFVADHNNDRVQVFDRDGTFLRCFGRKSIFSFSRKFGSALGLTGDALGRVYVADAFQGHVKVFDDHGVALSTIGSFGDGPGQLRTPVGLAIDPFGRLLVSSVNTGRVELFGLDDFSDPACAGDAECPSNDGDACTVETCVGGVCVSGNVESGACSSCDDCIDNDGDRQVDADDPDCATLSAEALYAVMATHTGAQPGVVLGTRSGVAAVPGSGACSATAPFPGGPSRAQVCANSIAVMDRAAIEGEDADPLRCDATRQALFVDAALVAGLPTTDATIDAIVVDENAPREPCWNDPTETCPTATVEIGGGVQVLVLSSLVLERQTQLVFSAPPGAVLVVRVRGGFALGARAAVATRGGLRPRQVLWSVEGVGADVWLHDRSKMVGTIMSPRRTIILGRSAEVRGALFGLRVEMDSRSTVTHVPFVGLLQP